MGNQNKIKEILRKHGLEALMVVAVAWIILSAAFTIVDAEKQEQVRREEKMKLSKACKSEGGVLLKDALGNDACVQTVLQEKSGSHGNKPELEGAE